MSEQNMQNDLIFHLEKAIEENEFEIYYQPVIHTISGSLCGFEALVRWHHPEYGFLSPNSFIQYLENIHQIHHLDLHVTEEVCRRYAQEAEANHPVVPFSVNISFLDFEAEDIFRKITLLTEKYHVPANMLNIEITERAFAVNVKAVAETVRKFRAAGFQVWMDDFGSGYSSLNALKDFDLDELKIDMHFLSDLSPKSRSIISSIVSMAKNLHMVTLAEGVETEEQLEFLRSIGCDRLQGFYYSRPLPYEQVLQVLKEKNICFETEEDRRYYHEVNRINLLSPSPFNYERGTAELHGGGIPLALLEIRGGQLKFIYQNPEFLKHLESIGAVGALETMKKLKHFGILREKEVMDFLDRVIQKGEDRLEFTVSGDLCSTRGKLVSSSADRKAILLSATNITKAMDIRHDRLMDQRLKNLYAVYLRVSLMRPKENELVTVFSRDNDYVETDVVWPLKETVRSYAEEKVAEEDRAAYLQFLDMTDIEERIRANHLGFINVKIRTMDQDGSYSKKMYMAVPMGNHEVMLLVRYTNL